MTTIRTFEAGDRDDVVALSLRAWAPVFASTERVLGPSGVFTQLYPDWRRQQADDVVRVITDPHGRVWVAQVDTAVVGFAAVVLHDTRVGQVRMIAVDPGHQRRGVADQLLTAAIDWIRGQGKTVVHIGTGGDSGHAPARAAYESAGFTALPAVNYFKKI